MNPKRLMKKGTPRVGDVWVAKVRYSNGIGSKIRPVIITGIKGDEIEFYKCTTNSGAPGAYHVIDTISAGLYRNTYIVPRTEKANIGCLAHRSGELSRFDMKVLRC